MPSPESRFELEPQREQEPELETCLRRLTLEVVGKQIDTRIDRYLLRQVNDAHVEDTSEGSVLECQTSGCEASCVIAKGKKGIVYLVSESGTGICEEK